METLNILPGKKIFPYELPSFSYNYDSLEPYIDKMTMEIHYSRHHKSYIDNLNKAVAETEMAKIPLLELLQRIGKYPLVVRNNVGGHFNHSFFWNILTPNSSKKPSGVLLEAIEKKFGSFDDFKLQFSEAAKSRFGSGWAWLSVDDTGNLFVSSTPNQDNPLMYPSCLPVTQTGVHSDVPEIKGYPILALDVWEHAYYLKYQNKRPDYIEAFWNVVNWDVVEQNYAMLVE